MNVHQPVWSGLVALGAVVFGIAGLTRAEGAASEGKTLRQAAGDRLLIGAAIMSNHLDDPKLAQLIGEQFNCLTAENEMKPASLEGTKGQFTFDAADKIVAFAQAHDMKVIGHNLCWHAQTPAWMFADENKKPLSRDAALANLREHIDGVLSHYKGKVKGWDVVNEAIADSEPYLRDTPARKAIGDDYVVQVFKIAHEADPDAELYYNDYNIEAGYKRPKALRLIKELKAAGCRVDGVGIQGHWLLDQLNFKEIEDGIRAFSDLGVKVMITELDVDPLPRAKGGRAGADVSATERGGLDPYKDRLPDDVQKKLAKAYGDLFRLFLKYPQVTRVTFWGTHDGTSWLNNYPTRGRTNHPLLWDRQLQPKPAFDAVVEALQSRR
jgi:endo-1,4-beta-xylanase